MSGKRMCQSYEIIDSRRVGNTEVVLGYSPTEVSPYVTWKCYAYDNFQGYNYALESAPKPGARSKAGDRPERAQETTSEKNGPGPVTAALAPLSAPAWHFDSKMPLVRGSAPDTPTPPKVPSI